MLEAVRRAEDGQVDADLGGGVIKQRLARPGMGKSGAFRTVIFFRSGALAVFVYAFSKSDRDNLDADEEKAFKKAAKHVLQLTDRQLDELVEKGDFREVERDEQEVS